MVLLRIRRLSVSNQSAYTRFYASPVRRRSPLMANIDDVAKLAGVSTATVSAVLNGQDVVKPQTRRRVNEAIRKLNYHPNLFARSLARGRSALLGLVISDIINPFF